MEEVQSRRRLLDSSIAVFGRNKGRHMTEIALQRHMGGSSRATHTVMRHAASLTLVSMAYE